MAEARVLELFLDEHSASARLECPPALVPAPGQYVLAHSPTADDPLAIPLFSAGDCADGFLTASRLPRNWHPGTRLRLRGPLGNGFTLPVLSRRVALVVFHASPAYLLGLIPVSLAQGASVALVCDSPPGDLPADVEIHPMAALMDICAWADTLALVTSRPFLPELEKHLQLPRLAQALILSPMPCGGLAECGVCTIETKRGNKLVCEDGPVFDLADLR